MTDWGQRLGNRGKAMIAVVVVPLLVPAVVGSFHAIRVWANTEKVNPSIVSYYDLIDQARDTVNSLETKVAEEASDRDWEAAAGKIRREDRPEVVEVPEVVKTERPRAFMLGNLQLQGIIWKEGKPIVYVNHELVELNEQVEGWTVTHIGKDKMVVSDPAGNQKTYDLDQVLEQLYPGYARP
jgi:hypothetical protein